MKTIFTFIVMMSISVALVAAEPPYSYNQLKYELQNLQFVNESTGWMLNAHETRVELLKSTDSGKTWFSQEIFDFKTLNFAKFLDEKIGFISASQNSSTHNLFITEDGGDTWSEIALPSNKKVNSIHFFSQDIFWLSQAGLYKTVDRGKTWHLTHDNSYEFNALQFLGLMNGWALDKFSLVTTTDAGLTWNQTKHTFWSIQLIDGIIGYGAKEDSLFKTDDFGATWNFVNKFKLAYTFSFLSKNVGFKIGDSGVEKTVDGGKTWKLYLNEKFNDENLYEVAMLSNQDFIILSNKMILNRTSDNGKTWDIKHFGAHSDIWDIKGIDDQRLIVCGEDGLIGRTTNGGDMWEFRYDITHHNLRKIQIINNTVYIQGDSATFLKSTDFGENWQKIKLPDAYIYREVYHMTYYPIRDGFHFRDENNGWIVGKGGIAFKTSNGGESFEVIKFDVDELYDVLFIDENIGYMLGSNEVDYYSDEGVFLITTNGGKDWQFTKRGFARFEYFDKDYLLISGGGTIFRYDIKNKTSESIYSDYRNIEGFFILDINTIWGWSMFEATCTFFKTTNGGEKWNFIENGCNMPTSLYFTDENNGWMIYYNNIRKTNNGGYKALKTPQLINPPNNSTIPLDSLVLKYRFVEYSIEIQIAKDSLFSEILTIKGNLSNENYRPENLELYQKYFWRVRSSISSSNYSPWSEIWSFEVRWAKKTKVKLITPLGIEVLSMDLNLSWNQLDYADKYRVQLSLDSSFQTLSIDTVTSIHGIWKAKFLTINERYYWRVKALNSTDSTIWSNTGYFKSMVVNSVDMINTSGFSIHPNPATEYLEITVTLNPTVNRRVDEGSGIKIYNTLGECVLTEPIHPMTPSHRMNVEHLPRGVYYIRIGNRTQMFVKM
ncbi:MAG: hypothetical protein CVV22_07610 [Ignavibacteriae bacterium HGW-Ignavibacteriae-1]|jgi:photosystem II stability/assembly factor-like uncharacterized protein|nr:MAG: hypothetical protein CVV22_07610 [Ignavibacteriae bacterium HGW-Ignavibacteriae-1]